jgi:hypothetical protein
MKYWEIIADNLSKAGWSWDCVATVDREGRTIYVADAHRDDGKRLVVHADDKLTAFLGLESRFWDTPDLGSCQSFTNRACPSVHALVLEQHRPRRNRGSSRSSVVLPSGEAPLAWPRHQACLRVSK